jgi:peptidoglycan hydrolase FlgJ
MNTISAVSSPTATAAMLSPSGRAAAKADDQQDLRQTFDCVVGESLFGQMLKEMRKSVHKSAYFHGGRGEEVFQAQLDQVMAEKISRASADKLTGPMFELFTLRRG